MLVDLNLQNFGGSLIETPKNRRYQQVKCVISRCSEHLKRVIKSYNNTMGDHRKKFQRKKATRARLTSRYHGKLGGYMRESGLTS